MMQEPVEDGGRDGAVMIEDFRPVLEDAVGGEENGAALIAVADDLKQEVGAGFVEGQIPEFVITNSSGFRYFFISSLSRPAAWAAARVLMISTAVANSTLWPFRQAV